MCVQYDIFFPLQYFIPLKLKAAHRELYQGILYTTVESLGSV